MVKKPEEDENTSDIESAGNAFRLFIDQLWGDIESFWLAVLHNPTQMTRYQKWTAVYLFLYYIVGGGLLLWLRK